MKKIERNSEFELMRIISMLLIILYHIVHHGNISQLCTTESLKNIFKFIEMATLVHVSSFVLLTGYYQSTNKFNQSKLWKIINASWFYRTIIVIIFLTLNIIDLDKLTILKDIFPLDMHHNWFIKCYIMLYLISPLINTAIKEMNQTMYKKINIILFIVLCFLPWLTGMQTFDNNGYTLYQFIFLYLIGGYLRKYPINDRICFKHKSNLFKRSLLFLIMIVSVLINFTIYKLSFNYIGNNSLINEITRNIQFSHILYSNPFVVIQSITYFLFFSTFKFKNKFINIISTLTIGVYLIHDNNYIRANIYTWLNINNTPITSFKTIIYLLLIAVFIFITCAIIEFIRQKIFLFIYNKKISTKIRKQYYNLFNKINI